MPGIAILQRHAHKANGRKTHKTRKMLKDVEMSVPNIRKKYKNAVRYRMMPFNNNTMHNLILIKDIKMVLLLYAIIPCLAAYMQSLSIGTEV